MDRAKFDQLAIEHLDALYRMAMQLSRRPEEAADLVQETYVKAIRAADRFAETGGGMRAWLFKILHNVFYTRVGKAKRETGMTDGQSQVASDGPAPDEPEPAWNLADLDWEHVDDRLKRSIERLKPEYRSVLLLWGVEGMKYREIADIQEIPIGTVMSRLHRARGILAQDLADLAEERRLASG